jgi:hypothetical protein
MRTFDEPRYARKTGKVDTMITVEVRQANASYNFLARGAKWGLAMNAFLHGNAGDPLEPFDVMKSNS